MTQPSLFDLLSPLQGAVDNLANTWRPDDPAYIATSTARP